MPLSFDDFPLWGRDTGACTALVVRRHATLKIILKTCNDPWFLERWIRHHAGIVGMENLIVFDNLSDDPTVLDIYRRHAPELAVIRFAGWCDDLHNTDTFRPLYDALAASSAFFCAIDTDEFLTRFDAGRCLGGPGMVDVLAGSQGRGPLPVFSLDNTDGRDDRFVCGTTLQNLLHAMAWGKPVMPSAAPLRGYINHPVQVAPELYTPRLRTDLAILHLRNLWRAQRIASTVAKLRGIGFAPPGETAEALAARDLAGIQDFNVNRYVPELRRLLGDDPIPRDPTAPLRPGCLQIDADGTLAYGGTEEAGLLRTFLDNPMLSYEALTRRRAP
jgi:hypothetical protein